MNGQDLLNFITSLLGNETPDPVFMLQLINVARGVIEMRRPWQQLKTVNSSQTVPSGNNYTSGIALPADFRRFVDQESILLFGGNQLHTLNQIPIEKQLYYRNEFGKFFIDLSQAVRGISAGKFYVTGSVPGAFPAYLNYIRNPGNITLTSYWPFPDEYHPILAFEAVTMYRLGTDYDDISARNADNNAKMADQIYKAMTAWDAELAVGMVENTDPARTSRSRIDNWGGYPRNS